VNRRLHLQRLREGRQRRPGRHRWVIPSAGRYRYRGCRALLPRGRRILRARERRALQPRGRRARELFRPSPVKRRAHRHQPPKPRRLHRRRPPKPRRLHRCRPPERERLHRCRPPKPRRLPPVRAWVLARHTAPVRGRLPVGKPPPGRKPFGVSRSLRGRIAPPRARRRPQRPLTTRRVAPILPGTGRADSPRPLRAVPGRLVRRMRVPSAAPARTLFAPVTRHPRRTRTPPRTSDGQATPPGQHLPVGRPTLLARFRRAGWQSRRAGTWTRRVARRTPIGPLPSLAPRRWSSPAAGTTASEEQPIRTTPRAWICRRAPPLVRVRPPFRSRLPLRGSVLLRSRPPDRTVVSTWTARSAWSDPPARIGLPVSTAQGIRTGQPTLVRRGAVLLRRARPDPASRALQAPRARPRTRPRARPRERPRRFPALRVLRELGRASVPRA
jgi:hypothetical protein